MALLYDIYTNAFFFYVTFYANVTVCVNFAAAEAGAAALPISLLLDGINLLPAQA